MDSALIEEIKKKREFSKLPDSVVERAIGIAVMMLRKFELCLENILGCF